MEESIAPPDMSDLFSLMKANDLTSEMIQYRLRSDIQAGG